MPKINFNNLKNLKLNNTLNLERLRACSGIERVELIGSKILSIASFRKQVPEVLLTRNNMADYTQVNLNGQPISESNIEKLKNGYMRISDGDRLEILDGCLGGHTFVISVGLPIAEVIHDISIANHIKERLGKSSLMDRITGYDLDGITWLGKDPSTVTDDDYYGYFRNKVIQNYDDLKLFNNLEYVNFAGAIIPNTVTLSDFGCSDFRYSFANCVTLSTVVLDRECGNTSYMFKNCTGLSNIDMRSEFRSLNADRMFMNCTGIFEFTATSDSSNIVYELDMFEGGRVDSVSLENIGSYNDISLFQTVVKIAKKIDLRGHSNIDSIPITVERVSSVLELNFSDSDIGELILKDNPNMNFVGLQKVYVNNTPNLRKVVSSDNLHYMYAENSGILTIKELYDRRIRLLADTSNLNYTEITINGSSVSSEVLALIKSGEYEFIESSVIRFIDGVLIGHEINFTYYDELPTEGMRVIEIFPDHFVANYVAVNRLGLADYNVVVTQEDLDRILYFGYDNSSHTYYSISDFKNIEISSWDGLKFLRELKSIFLKEFKGEARYIDISNSSKMVSLKSAFHSCPSNIRVKFPKIMNELLSIHYIFGWTGMSEVDIILPEQMDNLGDMDYSFMGSGSKSIVFPKALPNCTSAIALFTNGQSPNNGILRLPEQMPKVTRIEVGGNQWDYLKEVYFPKVCPLITNSLINDNWYKLEKVYISSDMPNLRNVSTSNVSSKAKVYFHENNIVTSKVGLPYHDDSGVPVHSGHGWDYSRLLGLTFLNGDVPDKRLIGAMGVREGQFRYWFADNTIKPIGIENTINLNDNGAYHSSCGEFQGKVNYDSLYMGEGYENLFVDLSRYDYGDRQTEIEKLGYNDYNVEVIRIGTTSTVVHFSTNVVTYTDNTIRFKLEGAPSNIIVGLGDNGHLNSNIQKDEEGYYRTGFNHWGTSTFLWFNNVKVGDKFRVYDIQVFPARVNNFVNDRVYDGKLSIPVDWELDTHSVIMKEGRYSDFLDGEGKFPIALNSYSCYHRSEYNFRNKPISIMLSNTYKQLISGEERTDVMTMGYLATPNRITLSVHDLPHLRYNQFGVVLFYEDILTQAEMEAELEKNIIIPKINSYERYVPNYLGVSELTNPTTLIKSYTSMALSADEYPTQLMSDGYDSVEVNGVELHINSVNKLRSGEFRLPREGKYRFKTYRDGKWTREEYVCLYSETMEDVVEDIEEADLLLIE